MPFTGEAAYIQWVGGTGPWNDAANWDLQIPAFGYGAYIRNGGTATLGVGVSGEVNELRLGGPSSGTGGVLLAGGILSTKQIFFGYNDDSTGSITVNSGTLDNLNEFVVGYHGWGYLRVTGGLVDVGQGFIGYESNSVGTVIVSGGRWTNSSYLAIGFDGTAGLTITNDGVVASGGSSLLAYNSSNSLAVVTVANDATWSSKGSLVVGYKGVATVNINGGQVSNGQAAIGNYAGSVGTVTMTNGTWTSSKELYVGLSGEGTMIIHGGSVISSNSTIGANPGSDGRVAVTGGGWTNVGDLLVGGYGTGEMNISGGKIQDATALIGGASLSTGTVTMTNGVWHNTADFVVGYAGQGTLTLRGGGITNGTGVIGYYSNSTGTVNMSGGTWDSSKHLVVGYGGSGELNLSGGRVSAAHILIGYTNSGVGTVNMSGGTLTTPGDFYAGYEGAGTLTLSGGSITNSAGIIAHAGTSAGAVTVSNGTWNNSGNLYVGYGGSGALTIAGGTVTSATMSVGYLAGSDGTLALNGGELQTGRVAGGSGSGSLVFDGGTLQATGDQGNFIGGLSGGVAINAGGASIDSGGFAVTVSSALTGAGALNKLGAGTLTLTADNTYSGGTTISNGTLQIGGGGTSGWIAGGVTNNGTLAFNRSDNITFSNVISGAGALQQLGGGTLTLTASNTYSGGTTINNGALQIGNGGTSGWIAGKVTNDGTLAINRSDSITFSNAVSGSGSLVKLGMGTLTLSGNNTYSGATTVDAGVLKVTATNALSADVTVHSGGTFDVNGLNLGTRSAIVAGTGAAGQVGALVNSAVGVEAYVNKLTLTDDATIGTGAGKLNVNGNIDGGGHTLTIAGTGQTDIRQDNAFNNLAGITVGSGLLRLESSQNWNGTISILNGGTLDTWGTRTEAAALDLKGGTLASSGPSGAATWTGAVSITSNSVINTALRMNLNGALSGNGKLTKTGAQTLALGGDVSAFTGPIQLDAGTLLFNGANAQAYSGDISGNGAVEKSGAGTLTLTGANTYVGGTLVSAGVLAGDSTSLQGAVTNYAIVFFDQSTNGTYAGAMSGSGSLVKSGVATLTLSGSNTYTGATIINGGTLAVTASGLPASGSGISMSNSVFDYTGATATIDRNFAVTGGTGIIRNSGGGTLTLSGALSKDGTGLEFAGGDFNITGTITGASANSDLLVDGATVTLNSTNTYNGATFIRNAGTLVANVLGALPAATRSAVTLDDSGAGGSTFAIGADQQIASLAGAASSSVILSNSTTLSIGMTSGNTTFAGAVSGAGSLVKDGASTQTLTGANTFSGGTLVSAGVLVGDSGGLQGTITNNATVIFDQSTNGTYAGVMSGAGSLAKLGTGTLTLTAGNTYSGGTTISNGTLQIGNGATSGWIAGDVANNASLAFNRSDNITFSNVISGTGAMQKLGVGTLILTASNTYTGGTLVSAGALAGDATSLRGAIINNATVIFDQSINGTYAGAMSGTGVLTKSGGGALTISSASTYTGGSRIESGTVVVQSQTALGTGAVDLLGGTLQLESQLDIGSLRWDGAATIAIANPGAGHFANLGTNILTLTNGVNNFDLTGFTLGRTPVRLMTALNMSSFSTADFAALGTGSRYQFSISNNSLWILTDELIAVPGVTQVVSGSETYSTVTYEPSGKLLIDPGALLTIREAVVMNNNSTTTVNGTFTAPSFAVEQGSTLAGGGTLNGNVVNSGTFSPTGATSMTINGNLTFTATGTYRWSLLGNTTSGPGVNYTAPVTLNGSLTVADGAAFSMFLDPAGVDSSDPFWKARGTNSWTVMTGTELAEGLKFRPTWAAGSQTNGFRLNSFYMSVVGNSLVLNYVAGLVVFTKTLETESCTYPWISYEPDGTLEIPAGVTITIEDPVVMNNKSTTVVNGTFTASGGFTCDKCSILMGAGVLNGAFVNNGRLRPGNSVGTITFNGAFTQGSGGLTEIEVADVNSFDLVVINGAATLAGGLQVTAVNGTAFNFGNKYQFLTASGGITGGYDWVAMSSGYRGRFTTGANNTQGTLLVAPQSYTQVAITPNQERVAAALNAFIPGGIVHPGGDSHGPILGTAYSQSLNGTDRDVVSLALDELTAAQYPAAFEAIMPSIYASIPTMAFNQANALNTSLFQRMWMQRINGKGFSTRGMALAPMQAEMGGMDDMQNIAINPARDRNWGAFVDGNGIFATANSAGALQDYHSQSGGVAAGASYKWNDNIATGVYAGYQGLKAQYDNGSRLTDNAVRFGGFGTFGLGGWYLNGLAGGAWHTYDVDRAIEFGTIDRTANGKPGAGEFDVALATGYDIKTGRFTFGPVTSMQYTYIGVQGFNETGADALNLGVNRYNASSLLYSLGGQVAYRWEIGKKFAVTPMLSASWQHEFMQNAYPINAAFNTSGPASPFFFQTSQPQQDYFYGGAGMGFEIGETWNAGVYWNAAAGNADLVSQNFYFSVGAEF